MATSSYWMLEVTPAVANVPIPLISEEVCDVGTGTDSPTVISASWLSIVWITGVESTLLFEVLASAWMTVSRFRFRNVVKYVKPPAPDANAAAVGKLLLIALSGDN